MLKEINIGGKDIIEKDSLCKERVTIKKIILEMVFKSDCEMYEE